MFLAFDPRRLAAAPSRACLGVAIFRGQRSFTSPAARHSLATENIFNGQPIVLNRRTHLLNDGLQFGEPRSFDLLFQFGGPSVSRVLPLPVSGRIGRKRNTMPEHMCIVYRKAADAVRSAVRARSPILWAVSRIENLTA